MAVGVAMAVGCWFETSHHVVLGMDCWNVSTRTLVQVDNKLQYLGFSSALVTIP